MTREEQAVAYKHSGYNCCQSVVKSLADLTEASEDTLNKLASGFAGGMGCMEATCGALVGATMMAGLVKDGKGTPMTARDILHKFQEKSKATLCRELKGQDTGVVLCDCDQCVKNAVASFCEVLDK